jgi:hypothetical protein
MAQLLWMIEIIISVHIFTWLIHALKLVVTFTFTFDINLYPSQFVVACTLVASAYLCMCPQLTWSARHQVQQWISCCTWISPRICLCYLLQFKNKISRTIIFLGYIRIYNIKLGNATILIWQRFSLKVIFSNTFLLQFRNFPVYFRASRDFQSLMVVSFMYRSSWGGLIPPGDSSNLIGLTRAIDQIIALS